MQTKILLVEDDLEIARVIRDMLLREGYEVTWATTGLEGWEDFQLVSYDLVLVDLMLPEMDGFSLCKNIRLKSQVPLVIISARNEDTTKIKGLGLGADDYISKPFSLAELKARVESHLRRWRRYLGVEVVEDENRSVYENGLCIDWNEQKVSLSDNTIALTLKEFDLLTLLAQHPRNVFTKRDLYEHIWSDIAADGLHTVTVHVKSLREKLMDSAKDPMYIQTVWGRGYRFIGELA